MPRAPRSAPPRAAPSRPATDRSPISTMADLARLQQQFYDRVVGRAPGDPDSEDPGDAELIGSGDIAIYARMYASRLHDTLADDYPKLRTALGDERFGELAAHYLRVHPPS